MTDGEDDSRYPHDRYDPHDDDDDDDDDDDVIDNEEVELDDDDDDDDDEGNGVQRIGKDDYEGLHDDDDDYCDLKHPKKRKLKTLLSNYEFAPRVPPPPSAPPPPPKPSHGGRNPLTDWTEHETLVLLDAWGDRFLKQGRKNLRSEEWQEVAKNVSHESKIERTDTQCRNRLDTLKKKYKKEKAKPGGPGPGPTNNWTYFKKMDSLLGLSCGAHLDEMRGSPGNSEPESGKRRRRRNGPDGGSFGLLADCIRKFGDVYKRIESCKREQMVEIEKMRMDFHRDLEMQKREILERARVEIEKIRCGDDEDND